MERDRKIPLFEGHPVEGGTAIKLSGAIPMDELDGVVIGIDDVVQMVATFRCVNVHHNTNGDGQLVRIQVMRPLMMDLHPFELGKDDGIKRALPTVVKGELVPPPPVCTCGSTDDGHTSACGLVVALGMNGVLGDGERIYIGVSNGA